MLTAYLVKMILRQVEYSGAVCEYGQYCSDIFRLSHIMHNKGIPRSTFYRAVNDLINHGLIVRVGRDQYITYLAYYQGE